MAADWISTFFFNSPDENRPNSKANIKCISSKSAIFYHFQAIAETRF